MDNALLFLCTDQWVTNQVASPNDDTILVIEIHPCSEVNMRSWKNIEKKGFAHLANISIIPRGVQGSRPSILLFLGGGGGWSIPRFLVPRVDLGCPST